MLKDQFLEVCSKYSNDSSIVNRLWSEVQDCYSKTYRHYHTISHIEHFHEELKEVKYLLKDWDCLMLSMFYHDIVFLPTRNDNEKSSADVASVSLALLDVPQEKIDKCQQLILATKKHAQSKSSDTNFFTDADLSILGSSADRYEQYLQDIKKEYYYLSEDNYRIGRTRIIDRLLGMEQLYKTQHFFAKYEKQARQNLRMERAEIN